MLFDTSAVTSGQERPKQRQLPPRPRTAHVLYRTHVANLHSNFRLFIFIHSMLPPGMSALSVFPARPVALSCSEQTFVNNFPYFPFSTRRWQRVRGYSDEIIELLSRSPLPGEKFSENFRLFRSLFISQLRSRTPPRKMKLYIRG